MYAVPDRFKTKKMCEKAVEDDARSLAYVSDRFKTQKMFIKALKVDP